MTRPQLLSLLWAHLLLFYTDQCLSKYLDGKLWLVDKKPTLQTIQATGYTPDANDKAALTIARDQWKDSLNSCFVFGAKAKSGVKCSDRLDAPYLCVEKGSHDAGSMSAGIGAPSSGKFPAFKAKSEYVEAGYTFAANIIGRALGLRSQMEVRPDFKKYIHRNDEALIQSMASLTESYGMFKVLKDNWSVKDLEHLAESIYARHCKKTVFTFDHPFDFRSIGNSFSAFGDVGNMLAFEEPSTAYVARDRANQWMIGYSQLTGAGQMISHYDAYKVMKDYNCAKVFNCKKPPRCRNFAYIDKDCECACAPGFSGTLCEIWSGEPYPRALKAMCSATVSQPMILSLQDLEFHVENQFKLSDFALGNSIGFYSQWCTVVIQAFGDKRPIVEPIANMFIDGSPFTEVMSASTFVEDWIDCSGLMTAQVLYSNATKRRVLCFSSLYLEDSPQIRPNRSDSSIDITWLWTIYTQQMVPAVFKMKLGITYQPMAPKILRVFLSEKVAFKNMNDDDSAMRSVGGVAAGAIAGTVVALLCIAGVVGGLYYVQKKKLQVEDMEQIELKED